LFVNTHPAELEGPGLIGALRAMRELSRCQPITLEIHEKAITEREVMKKLRSLLRELHIGLAFDDFGAGQTRLGELCDVQPDYLKFDMSLVHNLDSAPEKQQRMVGSLVTMVRDMGVIPLAEGIETERERRICVELGFELAQGFFFGRPVSLRHSSANDFSA
jgi:EAL domain-containing protein (putative c-di-GMP-specific phosphodiesterase class I)